MMNWNKIEFWNDLWKDDLELELEWNGLWNDFVWNDVKFENDLLKRWLHEIGLNQMMNWYWFVKWMKWIVKSL